jgi:hypothetical protein
MAKAAQARLLPYIKSLTIDGSQLSYLIPDANTRVNFSADTVMINEQRQITIEGDGRWQGEDFQFSLRGDPLLELVRRTTNVPYAIKGTIHTAASRPASTARSNNRWPF